MDTTNKSGPANQPEGRTGVDAPEESTLVLPEKRKEGLKPAATFARKVLQRVVELDARSKPDGGAV